MPKTVPRQSLKVQKVCTGSDAVVETYVSSSGSTIIIQMKELTRKSSNGSFDSDSPPARHEHNGSQGQGIESIKTFDGKPL